MAQTVAKDVAVIGAGIVGVSTAIWLQRAGHRVTLIDREGPASGTSYGNAGVLAAGSVIPVSVPGLWRKAPGMLFDPDGPLFLRWSYLPRLVPFLVRFLRSGTESEVRRISQSLALLLHDTAAQHLALAEGTGAEAFIDVGDYVFGYDDRAAFAADSFGWGIRRERGIAFEEMDQAQIAAYDPALAGRVGYAVRCPDHGRIRDPGAYVKALAGHFEGAGGRLLIAEVSDIDLVDGKATEVVTSAGPVAADDIVLATGVWSRPLAAKLGVKVPMESERGYHIEFVNPSIVPRSPVMVASGKFVVTPMNGRLRCAGIVEFGGLEAGPSRRPFELLRKKTLALFPDLEYERIDEWMGHRPSTTDSLPLIGRFDGTSNVWSGFGHHHVGLTGGPKTGRWLAQLIDGQTPNVDLAPMSPNRFS
ncbi:MAG: NAD(P)/FAD-dependent oxidoreductase [Hyphomicrobiaceae bacterium]